MKAERNRRRHGRMAGAVLALALLLGCFATEGLAYHNITQNWEAAAVYYSAPCFETDTFRMSEREFYARKVALEEDLIRAYGRCLAAVPEGQREALKTAQKAWIDCYYAYIDMLRQVWDSNIKVDFEVYGKERRTNIYRDIVLVMLANRVDDLNSWSAGRFADLGEGSLAEKQQELAEGRTQLQVDMGLCLYVTTENYREKMMTAHRLCHRFLDEDQAFLRLACGGDERTLAAEGLLQLQRMSYVTKLHYAGCRFYHIEREE